MTLSQPPFADPGSVNRERSPQVGALGLNALLRIAQHGVGVVDADGLVLEWNAGAEQLFGYPARELLGRPVSGLIAAGDRPAFDAALSNAKRDAERVERLVSRGIKQDGREVSLEVSIASCDGSHGSLLGVVMHDITKQVLAERRLDEVERNWRDIARNSSDVLLLLDRVGTIIFASRGLRDMTPSELSGRNVSELLPHLSPVLANALSTVFDAGQPFEHEGQLRASPQHSSWLWCRFAPQREDGDVARAVLSISDIGERRARDLALRRLAHVVERTKDAVLTADARGDITTWNRGAELLWGWTHQEIIGKKLKLLCPPDLLDEQLVIFGRLRDGKHVNAYDAVALAKNRRRIPVSVSAAATRNDSGQFEGISAVVRDMSHYQELQEALQRAKSSAETASQLKSEFLANMSHELRTPLNGVVGIADLLLGTPLTPEQQGFVATLLEASQALRVIVDDVLDFSKIEAGQLRIENVEFDLIALANAAVDMFRHAAEQNGTLLRFEPPRRGPLRIMGDPNRIRQVLINLLSNAVKFTRNGVVDLKLAVTDAGPALSVVRAEVADTGVGISPEAHALIFQPFAQADGSITRRFGGTGLGLSICRKLMELMGGGLGFESQPGVGSRFWFQVTLGKPTSSAARRGPLPAPVVPKNDERWRILVAEDNAINQKVVTAMLRSLGAEVDIAHNGQEVVAMHQAGAYHLILMDCQMPLMSGFEATEAIRRLEGASRIPIVAMTAQAYAQDRERCARAGMDDHLAKPVTKRELEATLAKWLRIDETPSLAAPPSPPRPGRLDRAWLGHLEADLGEGGRELLCGLIDAFIVDFEAALGKVREASAQAAWSQIGFEAHRLRSSTGSLGALALADLCARLERACRQPRADDIAALIASLEREFILACEALRAFASPPSDALALASSAAATQEKKNASSP
jgi:PAS domain S-box-containing protein